MIGEAFKRDAFKCQYCGRGAPDSVRGEAVCHG